MSETFCRTRARRLLAEVGVTAPPVDVAAVAQALGLQLRLVSRDRAFRARLLRERLEIEVNRSLASRKGRFAVAHEIGHFVLGHSPVVNVLSIRSSADPHGSNERQATSFATELLMPEPWLRPAWEAEHDHHTLADLFDVSEEDMVTRLLFLHLLRYGNRR